MSTAYDVRVTREGGAWLADVPAVEGAHTYARSLPGLTKSVREVIILMNDLDDDTDIDLCLNFYGTDQVIHEAVRVGQQRRAIAEQEAAVMASTASSVTDLIKVGYSVRDVAELLHITAGPRPLGRTRLAVAAGGQKHRLHKVTHRALPGTCITPGQGRYFCGAACRNRTDDLFITSEMLYRLS
jgi:hypothetical protein